jgi:diguanylate cyclase (GGDEF)-like protein
MPSLALAFCGRQARARWLLLCVALCTPAVCSAWATPPSLPMVPAVEIRSLLAQAEALQERDIDQALALTQRAVAIARGTGDAALLREAQQDLCVNTAVVDARTALTIAEDGFRAARKAGDVSSSASFIGCKGFALELQGKPGEAAVVYEAAVAAAEIGKNKEILADTLAMRGENRHYHGRFDDAIADLNRSYALSLESGNKGGQRYALNAIANVYSDEHVGEFDKAIAYYRQLLKDDEAAGLKSGIATARFNIGSAMEMKGELDAALSEYRRALEIDTALNDAASIAEEERSIGALLVKQGKGAEALPWIERALAHYIAVDDIESTARARLARAKALRVLERPREAIEDLVFAERHFRKQNNPRYLAQVYDALAAAHADVGEWRMAYEASMAYREVQAKLDASAREEQSSRLRVQFDSARKEHENRALLIENAHRGEALRNIERVRFLQRVTIIFGMTFLALMAAMAWQEVRKGRRMRALAMTDDLTDLPNRRHILEFLERELRTGQADATPLGVIAFDVDHFKRINDTHGHHGGDRVLRAIAEIACRHIPDDAKMGRMGGEEFLVVVPAAKAEAVWEIAEALRTAISATGFEGRREGDRVTISLGVSEGGPEDDVETLLKRADAALYQAKREGRDRTVRG